MTRWFICLVLLLPIGVLTARAQSTPQDAAASEEIRRLRQRVDELERKLQKLEAALGPSNAVPAAVVPAKPGSDLPAKSLPSPERRETDLKPSQVPASKTPIITIGERGFGFTSADTNFSLQLKGVLQVDSRTFFADGNAVGNDGFLLRRARPILEGTVFRDFDFLFVPDFGGSGAPQIYDAYLNYRFRPELQFRAGKFKTPVGLEQLQSDKDVLFNERSLVTALVPNRDLGFSVHGELFGGMASYAVGIFNGVGDSRNSSNVDVEDDKAFAGRIFLHPFRKNDFSGLKSFGFGLGGSYEDLQRTNTVGLPATTGGTLPGYASVGQQQFFAYNPTNRAVVAAGSHWRLSPQSYYFYGPFGIMAEYAISDQRVGLATGGSAPEDLLHTAWQVSASWVLTGEDASFSGVVPRRPFRPRDGDWGAWQVALRYSELDIDDAAFPSYSNPRTSASLAREWSIGLNWYLNRNVLVRTSFSHTTFDGGGGSGSSAPAAVTRHDENVFFTRVQLAF